MMRDNLPKPRFAPTAAVVCALSIALTSGSARADNVVFARDGSGSALAREAVTLCLDAIRKSEGERAAMLERGLATAERAVAADDNDAKAHFAVFCNLGRKLEAKGVSLEGVAGVKRVIEEVDRAIALQPRFVDAVTAKGALLVKLPALLGGDKDEGERLIRRAIEMAPNHPSARLQLVKALVEKGEQDEARSEVKTVVALADRRGSPAEAQEAHKLAEELGASS
jgi:hypothetical protein